MPVRNNTKSMTTNRKDLAFNPNMSGNKSTALTTTNATDYELITYITSTYDLSSNCAKFIDLDGVNNSTINLPTTLTAGKIITLRNINDVKINVHYVLGNKNDVLKSKTVKTYIFNGTVWERTDSKIYDSTGANTSFNASITDGTGAAFSEENSGIAAGLDSFVADGALYSIAQGYKIKSNKPLQASRGGNRTKLRRTTEEGRNPSTSNNLKHYSGRVQWTGEITSIIGLYEMFLGGINGERFGTADYSSIAMQLKFSVLSATGAINLYSGFLLLTFQRGNGANTLTKINETNLYTYNSDPTVFTHSIVANTATGNIDVFMQSGSAVQAYDTVITIEADFIETRRS